MSGIKKYDEMTPIQLDALKEIGNIGAGNAAASFSDMLGKDVTVGIPDVRLLDYDIVVDELGGPEEVLVGLHFSLKDDVNGMMMFLIQKDFVKAVLADLTGHDLGEEEDLDEMDESALREVGNIMAASYVNAIADLTGLRIDISTPSLCFDMVGAILSAPTIYYANISDKILFIEGSMNDASTKGKSHVLLIPEIDSLNRIMESLGLNG